MKGFTREISPARSPSPSQTLRASVAWKAHGFILAAEEWEGVDWWVISQVIRWFQSSRVADYSSSPFEQTRQRQHASPLEDSQGRPPEIQDIKRSSTLAAEDTGPGADVLVRCRCFEPQAVLHIGNRLQLQRWSRRRDFCRYSESPRVTLGTGCSFSLCRRPETAETDI